MDTNALIQAELTRIEEEAARKTAQLLAVQDDYVAAHVLVDLLKAHGAAEDLQVTPIYHQSRPAIVIYPGFCSDKTVAAIERAGVTIDKVCEGFNADTTLIALHGYANVELYVKRSAMEWRTAA